MNDNNNEGDNYKIAGGPADILSDCPVGQQWGHLVNRTGCHKWQGTVLKQSA